MKIKFVFAWYDLWVGAYWDRKRRMLYVLPIPCIGFVLNLPGCEWCKGKALPCMHCGLVPPHLVAGKMEKASCRRCYGTGRLYASIKDDNNVSIICPDCKGQKTVTLEAGDE